VTEISASIGSFLFEHSHGREGGKGVEDITMTTTTLCEIWRNRDVLCCWSHAL